MTKHERKAHRDLIEIHDDARLPDRNDLILAMAIYSKHPHPDNFEVFKSIVDRHGIYMRIQYFNPTATMQEVRND